MKSVCIVLLVALSVSSLVSAFVPSSPHNRHYNNRLNVLSMMVSMVDMPPAVAAPVEVVLQASPSSSSGGSAVESGIRAYLSINAADTVKSSTLTLSLKDRPPPPSKEEIEAKQRNFNVLFWGGGFVAPFVATVFYFGPKFWEK
jgi:hypothetical protein